MVEVDMKYLLMLVLVLMLDLVPRVRQVYHEYRSQSYEGKDERTTTIFEMEFNPLKDSVVQYWYYILYNIIYSTGTNTLWRIVLVSEVGGSLLRHEM